MKGILFKPDIIKAIAEGRKTVTRRVVKPDLLLHFYNEPVLGDECVKYTRYQVGETIYIKEVHYRYGRWVKNGHTKTGRQKWLFKPSKEQDNFRYYDNPPSYIHPNSHRDIIGWFKRSPLFMSAWAARHFITVTGVRAERVQGITEEDAIKEGIESRAEEWVYQEANGNRHLLDFTTPEYKRYDCKDDGWTRCPQLSYCTLWDSINPKYPWSSNPWLWVYTFKLQDKV